MLSSVVSDHAYGQGVAIGRVRLSVSTLSFESTELRTFELDFCVCVGHGHVKASVRVRVLFLVRINQHGRAVGLTSIIDCGPFDLMEVISRHDIGLRCSEND